MEQENLGTIVPGEEIPANAVVDTPEIETPSPDIEARARAMGWRPQEEFNGDPNKWKPAEDFVAKGENDLPVLRENLRRMTTTVTDLQARLARQDQDFKSTISRVEKMSETALQRQRQQLDDAWSNAMRNATANGDVDQYDRLEAGKRSAIDAFDRQISEVKAAPPPPTPEVAPAEETAEQKAKIEGWMSRNPWYKTDPELNQIATSYSGYLTSQKPGMTLDENLKETEQWVRKRYADKFGTPASEPPAVEGGGSRMTASASRGKGWNDLPGDARAQGAKFIKEGLFKDQNDYAKEYWST